MRARIRAAEQHIKARSAAAETNWNSSDSSGQTDLYGVVGKILSVLEDLDRYVFDKLDPNTNCIDVLAAKIWGPCQPGQVISTQVFYLFQSFSLLLSFLRYRQNKNQNFSSLFTFFNLNVSSVFSLST